jgi:hypothetical protein
MVAIWKPLINSSNENKETVYTAHDQMKTAWKYLI